MNPSETEHLTGTFYRTLYSSPTSSYRICLYSNCNELVTVSGNNLPQNNLPVTFTGKWRETKKGRQFSAEIAMQSLPDSKTGIAEYISGMKVGISERLAYLMIDSVNEADFWAELRSDPLQFCTIKGIYMDAVLAVQSEISEIAAQQELFSFLGDSLRCNGKTYQQMCAFFQNDLDSMVQSIKDNPFVLMKCGYSFQELDQFCSRNTIFAVNDYRRLLAALQQILLKAKTESHVCLPYDIAVKKLIALLKRNGEVSDTDIVEFLDCANSAGDIICDNAYCYLPRSFDEETSISRTMLQLLKKPDDLVDPEEFNNVMKQYSEEKGFMLSQDQLNAVKTALEKSVCVITGGPGTGKSTILDAILTCWKNFHNEDWLLMAPTGKAAVRMTETTGQSASTIHSTLGLMAENEDMDNMDTDHNCLDASLIIVDESSMIDQSVMAAIASALSQEDGKLQHLVLVGDPEQLPSVSWGNILADFIASNVIPVCKLNTIYRQGKESPIITNSRKMQAGETDLVWDNTFVHYPSADDHYSAKRAVWLYVGLAKKYGIQNVVLLTPFHQNKRYNGQVTINPISVDSLNEMIQEEINPDVGQGQITAFNRIYRKGDRVMQLRNTHSLSNGDIGTIIHVDPSAKNSEPCLLVEYENGTTEEYIRDELKQLELAYSMTIHKSQGSQYRYVVIVMPAKHSAFLKRNLLYTAITRSSANIAIVGPMETLAFCILNNNPDDRFTNLIHLLHAANESHNVLSDESAQIFAFMEEEDNEFNF